MVSAVWKRLLGDSSLQRSSSTLSVVGNNALVHGGELRPREPVDSAVHRISLDTQTTPNISTLDVPNPPQPRVGAASTTLGGKVYIFSGRGGIAMAPIEEQGALWEFDPGNDTWSQIKPADAASPYPAARSYHALTSDGDKSIFLHAGCPEKGRMSDLWVFHISTKQWTELPSAPGVARGGPSIAFSQGKIYRMHGFDGKTEQGGAVDVFDLASKTWSSIEFGTGPSPRSVSCLLPLKIAGKDHLVTMFGEHDPSSLGHEGAGKMLSDVWAFHLDTEDWEKVSIEGEAGDGPPPRGWFAADVYKGGVIVHGGLSESNDRLGDVWLLEFQ